jgi:hypothetical protein
MRFNVRWNMKYNETNRRQFKPSGIINYDIYLKDDLENRYDHIDTGGYASQDTTLNSLGGEGDCNGWFQFPKAKQGTKSFKFIYSANSVEINDIILLPK